MSKSESFADLFAQTEMPTMRAKRLQVGDRVEGVVALINEDEVFVDLDAKQQGFFSRADLAGPDGELVVKIGDAVAGNVLAIDGDQVKLGTALGADAGIEQLQVAYEGGLSVEGKVESLNKGGAEILFGKLRAFCPVSQLDSQYVADPSVFLGQTLRFKITELKDRNIVLSRRKVLEEESAIARDALFAKLEIGAVMKGRVTQVRDFGAFVDLGGAQGLIPARELSYDRGQRPSDVLAPGDVAEVKILQIEAEGNPRKITLSLKALSTDPWDAVETLVPVGQVVAGQVTRLADFGAFVRIAPSIEGLLHVSELSGSPEHPKDVLEVGQSLLLAVKSIEKARRRISLTLAQDDAKAGDKAVQTRVVLGALVEGEITKIEHFGVFVQLKGVNGRGGRGLIPTRELSKERVDVRKQFAPGTQVRAKVIDLADGKMRLSIVAAHEDAERAVYDNFRQEQSEKASMGTFADLLKAKLNK